MKNRWSLFDQSPMSSVHSDWVSDDLTTAACLVGANGMTFGEDGRLYVTELLGGQVTALDIETGEPHAFSAPGDGIEGPDDCVFMHDGTFVVTETILGRVTARSPDGTTRVLYEDLPAANGIATDHRAQRLFIDECRPGGRLIELDPTGRAKPIVLIDELASPNALSMGPDGRLYLPVMGGGEIWAYDLEAKRGGAVFKNLASPTAVKFNSHGLLVTTESAIGHITAIDLESGKRSVLATVPGGIDNLSFTGDDRMFVSHFIDGRVAEELPNGTRRIVSESSLVGPYGLGMGPHGTVLIADAMATKALDPATGQWELSHAILVDLPVFAVGICEFLGGVAVLGLFPGDVLIYATGSDAPRVLVTGLNAPSSMTPDADGKSLLVAEAGASRVIRIDREGQTQVFADQLGRTGAIAAGSDGSVYLSHDSVVDVFAPTGQLVKSIGGFTIPQGIAVSRNWLLVADAGTRELVAVSLVNYERQTVLMNAPIGSPRGGPMRAAFCSITADADGNFYVGCNGDGVVRRIRRTRD